MEVIPPVSNEDRSGKGSEATCLVSMNGRPGTVIETNTIFTEDSRHVIINAGKIISLVCIGGSSNTVEVIHHFLMVVDLALLMEPFPQSLVTLRKSFTSF